MQGSLAFGAGNELVHIGNNSALGKGGILLYPFLDINQNGIMDTNEPMVKVSRVRVSGGKATYNNKDFVVKIPDLNAFINYTVEFSDNDLDNISWRFKHKTYQVLVDPNQYKKVYVPIHVLGEVTGMVAMQTNLDKAGQGRITLHIFDQKGNKVAETLSESDGYFSHLGLKPGDYIIKIDEAQLEALGYQAAPLMRKVTINVSVDGDIVGGLDFVLTKLKD
jgi:hypothetical protein